MASGTQNNTSYQAQKWTNLRSFTIGETGKNVDGTTNISWSKNEILGASDSSKFLRGDKTWSNTIIGDFVVNGNLSVGKTDNSNYITFYGITGDSPVQWAQHDYIGNRLWGSSESSELVLFKGNDVGNGSSATTVSGSGPDRIRHIAAAHLFQTYSSALSGTFEAVCTSSALTNIFEINTNNLTGYKRMILQENNVWLSPARLQLLRPDTTAYTDRACVGVTDGNLHIDPYPNKGLYLNFYNSGGNVYFNGATYYINGGYYNGTAAKAKGIESGSTSGDNVSAMRAIWDSLPSNQTLGVYIAHGSASFFYGWRLSGYNVANGTGYGGGIIDNYGNPSYLNVSNGSFVEKHIWLQGDSVTSAVWNDYAEARESLCTEPGRTVQETGSDTLTLVTERLISCAGIISDTWGFSQGETDSAKTHIAVAGRVLAYPYRDRNEYKPGDVLCAAPGGTVDIMTREEIIQYPDRIVGTVSCVPDYDEWGGGEGADRPPVKVNGRIWVKVK